MAQTEAAMAVNEALVAGYRAAGYNSVWASAPGCCKICTDLNGKTVTTLKPPLHKGCVCGVRRGERRPNASKEEIEQLLQLEKERIQELKDHPELALPNADDAIAPDAKFTGYLFSPSNPDGYAKGIAFETRLGYNITNWEEMQAEILEAARNYPAEKTGEIEWGHKYTQYVVLHGKKGTPANVKLGWNDNGTETRLTTVMMKKVKK